MLTITVTVIPAITRKSSFRVFRLDNCLGELSGERYDAVAKGSTLSVSSHGRTLSNFSGLMGY